MLHRAGDATPRLLTRPWLAKNRHDRGGACCGHHVIRHKDIAGSKQRGQTARQAQSLYFCSDFEGAH